MLHRTAFLGGLLFAAISTAAPIDSAIIAAMRLSEERNYSWSSSVEDDAGSYVRQGRHLREGYTWVVLPMLESISRRLGREAGTEIEAIFHNEDCVIRLGNRWKTVKQLPKPRREEEYWVAVPSNFGAPGLEDPFPPTIILTPLPERDESKPFSNARLAPSAPHEELALIISSWANVTIEGDTVRGTLTDTGARLLLCPGAEFEASPLIAAGEFTLSMKDKRVTRYVLKLEGVLKVGKKKVLVRQASNTSITAVGTTSFVIPDEARLKLAPAN
jgi:hypothetical protein